jgi:hypothetical protein
MNRGFTRLGSLIAIAALLTFGSACSSSKKTWGFELEPGGSWMVSGEAGEVIVKNEGPGTIQVVTLEAQNDESIIATAEISATITGGADSVMTVDSAEKVTIRNESDKRSRVRVTITDH